MGIVVGIHDHVESKPVPVDCMLLTSLSGSVTISRTVVSTLCAVLQASASAVCESASKFVAW